jgi:GMP synthase (glutamine-hydrolysing)
VICALSGGVDSSVAALLIHEAVGDQLTCILVDHGLMRKDEAKDVVAMFRQHYNLPLILVDASDKFVSALEGEADPEKKRKTIGRLFIEVFEEEAKKLGGADFLAQGTLYPDVIESVSFSGGPSVTIKSHHNVGGLPDRMNMQAGRAAARAVQGRGAGARPRTRPAGAFRRPPPVPRGRAWPSAARAASRARSSRSCARPMRSISTRSARPGSTMIWQAFAVLLPVQTVGVMGDLRTYEFVCALRAVTSVDGMTADFYHYDMTFLGRRHPHHQRGPRHQPRRLRRDTSKPPGTIEWE